MDIAEQDDEGGGTTVAAADQGPPKYEGVFLRDYVGEVPNSGRTGGIWDSCPDVICSGPLLTDPGVLSSDDSYKNWTWPLWPVFAAGQPEFVYVRGVNSTTATMTSRIWLFWVPGPNLLWPSTWQSQGIVVGDQSQNWQDLTVLPPVVEPDPAPTPPITATLNAATTAMPFAIVTGPLSSDTSGITLIALVDNAQPPASTAPLPSGPFASIGALSQWVAANGYVGYLRTQMPTTSAALTLVAPVSASGLVLLGAAATDLPADATISIQCPGPTFATSVNLSQAVGSNADPTLSSKVDWGAGFQSTMYVTVVAGSSPVPADATVRLYQAPAT